MDRGERLAWIINFGRIEGSEWDWRAMNWRERKD
jgi:hypothetical protein